MQIKLIAGMLGTAAAAATVTTLVLLPRSPSGVETRTDAAAQVQPATDTPGAMKQGIAVRGHWQIEVRNPDGTVAQRREFDNALVDEGKIILAGLLGGEAKKKEWVIRLTSAATAPCPAVQPNMSAACVIGEWLSGTPPPESPYQSFNLSVTRQFWGIRLSGSKTATRDGTINVVKTALNTCSWADGPLVDCAVNASFSGDFTSHDLGASTPISVVAGQQILVTVDISFAAAP